MDLLSLHLVDLRHDFLFRRFLDVVSLIVCLASIIALLDATVHETDHCLNVLSLRLECFQCIENAIEIFRVSKPL